MNTVIRTTLIILLLAAFPASIKAQEDLHSASVFQKYGKQKGVTMVELSRDMLDSYRIDLYRSLVFKDVTEALPYILDCLEKDQKEGTMKKIQEIIEDGKLQTAYYQLTQVKKGKEKLNRFLLFKIGKKNSATLIYIEGNLNSDELVALLFQRRN
ncbi:hypothetical protein HMPREF1214_03799 [Bacteroides sp. HPS0048]|uniref:DUF4252 domain-containing protein n=1 Tax=Bacteroides sp. HPS0048 TaxID=1078089 RepID=UPI00036A1AEF|nr:DUF4252 domain-containing protein [Bacteroides sp. HPS0048]EOA55455.1 hypothetical protein HMPREF1214_03799 [Bacteroides sp. HPS0048]